MAATNTRRVLLGGAVGGVAWTIWTMVVNVVILVSRYAGHIHLDTDIVLLGPPNLAGMSMADVEKLHIMNTLRMFGGNREKTAKALGIGARTLYRKLRDYGLR